MSTWSKIILSKSKNNIYMYKLYFDIIDDGNILYKDCSNLLNWVYKISHFLNYFLFNRIFNKYWGLNIVINFIQYKV